MMLVSDFTPHSEAKAASERSRSELLPATTNRVAAVVGPTPKASTRVGAIDRVSRSISASRSRTSSLEVTGTGRLGNEECTLPRPWDRPDVRDGSSCISS